MNIEPSKWAYAASEEIAPSYNEFDVLAAAYTIDNLAIEPAIAQLRARVAELEKEAMILRGTVEAVTTQRQQAEQRNAELESNCRDLRVAYEQNASQCVQLNRELAMKPDTMEWLNGVTIQRQRAEQAEAHIAELVAALRELHTYPADRAVWESAGKVLARAESATPAKQEVSR